MQAGTFKFGAEVNADQSGINHGKIEVNVRSLVRLPMDLVVVMSGAVREGRARWRYRHGDDPIDDQTAAAMGDSFLKTATIEAFERSGRSAGGVNVTHREIEDEKEGPVLRQALERCFAANVVPVFNENDTLSVKELAKLSYGGDNDGLAAHLAIISGSSVLGLLTDVDHLWDFDRNRVVEVAFAEIDHKEALAFAGERNERDQGMPTKVEAAIHAASHGIDAYIARAGADIGRILSGEIGTHFVAKPADM